MPKVQPCCCPHCGHCSKEPQYVYPWYPATRPWPWYPTSPWWLQPNITWTVSNTDSANNPDIVSIYALNAGSNGNGDGYG